eukprot:6190978-Pleurochrysis_carterae.AAC.1
MHNEQLSPPAQSYCSGRNSHTRLCMARASILNHAQAYLSMRKRAQGRTRRHIHVRPCTPENACAVATLVFRFCTVIGCDSAPSLRS